MIEVLLPTFCDFYPIFLNLLPNFLLFSPYFNEILLAVSRFLYIQS